MIFTKNPIKINLVNPKAGTRYTLLLLSGAPDHIVKEVKTAINSPNNKYPALVSYYGKTWRDKLGISVRGGSELTAIDQQLLQIKTVPTTKHAVVRERITLIQDFSVFPEDRISEFKTKIYVASGIPIYRQHLYAVTPSEYIPVKYVVNVAGIGVSLDLPGALETPKVLDLPVDMNMLEHKDKVEIISYDEIQTLGDMLKLGITEYNLIDLGDMLQPRTAFLESYKMRPTEIKMLYSAFVLKYWPIVSFRVLELMLVNEDLIGKEFPDLLPSVARLRDQFLLETKILGSKIEPGPSTAIVKKAVLTTTALPGRFQTIPDEDILLNAHNLFDIYPLTSDTPIIKAHIIINSSPIVLTKIKMTSDARDIYDKVKYRLQLPYFNSILIVKRFSSNFVVVAIRHNGKYESRVHWGSESSLDDLHKALRKNVGYVIRSVNKLGRQVFNSSGRLQEIKHYNSYFSSLNIGLVWSKSLVSGQFKHIRTSLQDDVKAGILHQESQTSANIIAFNAYKGIVDVRDLHFNYYERYTNPKVKKKWLQTLGAGKPVTIHRRAADVYIELFGFTRLEFEYFRDYIISRLRAICKTPVATSSKLTAPEQQTVKALKNKDPELFKLSSELPYSRICQSNRQPEIYSEHEFNTLSAHDKKNAVKYWNFTKDKEAYYTCPNPNYPYLGFIVNKHPKGYCLPCCVKTRESNRGTKKKEIYGTCIQSHSYIEKGRVEKSSRYIMKYGKILDIGRISGLPELLDKYFTYNVESEMPSNVTFAPDPNAKSAAAKLYRYSVGELWKSTKNNKTKSIPVSSLSRFLNNKTWSYRENKPDYSPKEIIDNPNLSSTHYARIVNADLKYPILIFRSKNRWQVILDGLHRLAKACMLGNSTIKAKFVSRTQLLNAAVKGVGDQPSKQSGFYIYGVQQTSSQGAFSIGALHSIAAAINMPVRDLLLSILKHVEDYFSVLLDGRLLKYFKNAKHLSDTIKTIFLNDSVGFDSAIMFTRWNELFIDIAIRCLGIYVIVFDDQAVDMTKDIKLMLNMHVWNIQELIPPTSKKTPITREYIVLLRKKEAISELLGDSYRYCPIFNIIPREFFKSRRIIKRIFVQDDAIMQIISKLANENLHEPNSINLTIIQKLVTETDYVLSKLYCTLSDMCYAVELSGITIPIQSSYYKNINLDASNEHPSIPVVRVLKRKLIRQTYMELKEFIVRYNGFVVDVSKRHNIARDERSEETIITTFPLIKITKLLVFNKAIIGFVSGGLYYYFKQIPLSKPSLKKFISYMKTGYNAFGVEISSKLLHHLYYDPDDINNCIFNNSVHNLKISATLRYPEFLEKIFDYLDSDRNPALRKKIKISISKGVLPKLPLDSHDMFILNSLLAEYSETLDKQSLIDQFDSLIYNFDKIRLNKLRSLSDGYLLGKDNLGQMREILDDICKALSLPTNMVDSLVLDLVNPLKRNKLLSSVIINKVKRYRFNKKTDERIYVKI